MPKSELLLQLFELKGAGGWGMSSMLVCIFQNLF